MAALSKNTLILRREGDLGTARPFPPRSMKFLSNAVLLSVKTGIAEFRPCLMALLNLRFEVSEVGFIDRIIVILLFGLCFYVGV